MEKQPNPFLPIALMGVIFILSGYLLSQVPYMISQL